MDFIEQGIHVFFLEQRSSAKESVQNFLYSLIQMVSAILRKLLTL